MVVNLPPGLVINIPPPSIEVLPPVIMIQPQAQTVIDGGMVNFEVGAAGTPPLSYQWRFNGVDVANATNGTFTITKTQIGNAGNYSVAVSNGAGLVTSQTATLTVNLPLAAPIILEQPQDQTITTGQSVTFRAVTTGTPPLAFQWRKNGANITGATNAVFTIVGAQRVDSGEYSVVVSNSLASVTSAEATLLVNLPAPTIHISFREVGSLGGFGTNIGSFRYPQGLSVGPSGELHVVDNTNRRIQVFENSKCL